MAADASAEALHQDHRAVQRKASHRVVFEEIAQNRKLKTFLSFNVVAPDGFTFIPAGDPQLTRRCKEISKRDGHAVFIVSNGIRAKFELSREINRVGHHFSNLVIEKASRSLNVKINAAGKVSSSQLASYKDESYADDRPRRYDQPKKLKLVRNDSPKLDFTLDQAIIDTQAREAIQDLFPKISARDVHEIVSRAFDKARGLVGTASGTSLVRRANLAVVAHIRHTYTNYDELLRTGVERAEARKGVEKFILDKLLSWRGDEEEDAAEVEDVLREVIIISDDENIPGQGSRPALQVAQENQTLRRLGDEYIVLANDELDASEIEVSTAVANPGSVTTTVGHQKRARMSDGRKKHKNKHKSLRVRTVEKIRSKTKTRSKLLKSVKGEVNPYLHNEDNRVRHVVRLGQSRDSTSDPVSNQRQSPRNLHILRTEPANAIQSAKGPAGLPLPSASGRLSELFPRSKKTTGLQSGPGNDLMAALMPAKTPVQQSNTLNLPSQPANSLTPACPFDAMPGSTSCIRPGPAATPAFVPHPPIALAAPYPSPTYHPAPWSMTPSYPPQGPHYPASSFAPSHSPFPVSGPPRFAYPHPS